MLQALTIAQVSDPNAPYMLQGRPFEESLRIAARYDYKGVEIQLRAPEDLDRASFFSVCEQTGIRLVSIATGQACREGLGLSSQDSSVRMRTVERLFSQIELAASCGHRPAIMIGLLIGRRSAAGSSEEYYSLLADSLKRVADRACAKDIPVNLEPVNHLDSDALNTWQETAEFLDRSGCEYIRLGMDLYHMRLEERDIAATLRNYKHRIGCVQLMDDNRMAPGLGLFDTSALAGLVKELNYDGPVIMECLPGSDPESSLKTAADFYKRSFSDRT